MNDIQEQRCHCPGSSKPMLLTYRDDFSAATVFELRFRGKKLIRQLPDKIVASWSTSQKRQWLCELLRSIGFDDVREPWLTQFIEGQKNAPR